VRQKSVSPNREKKIATRYQMAIVLWIKENLKCLSVTGKKLVFPLTNSDL
jgi:hypothetical protein